MIKNFLNKENVKQILILLFVSAFICIPLLSNKIDITYDDGIQHIARLIGLEASLKEGQTAIIPNLCNGFGYSWNLFYSPLTSFVPLIFRLLGLSYINSIKAFMFFVTFVSSITMYFFVKDVTKNKKTALLAGIIYIFIPYRITDMYIRNALAELTSFVFIPMIFQGLYGLFNQKKNREILLIIGSGLLILTHTIVAMYVAIICFIYLLTQIKKLKIKEVRYNLIYSAIIILTITSFFWLPLLELKTSADYEVFKPGRMERTEVLKIFKLDFIELFLTTKDSRMIYEIGLLNVVVLILTPLALKRLKEKKYKNDKKDFYTLYIFSIVMILLLSFMTLNIFPFEKMPSLLKMIQFSFRLLEFTGFFTAFIVAVNLECLFKELKYKHIILITIVLMILSLLFRTHLIYNDDINIDRLVSGVPVTAQTGRVHAGCASFEYLPSKAFENRNYIETRSDKVIVIDGTNHKVQIKDELKTGTNMSFYIENIEKETEIELPYIYYPGYKVTLENNNTNEELETYETDKGFVGVTVPKIENANVTVKYTGTSIMKISKILSIIGVLILTLNTFYNKRKIENGNV